jgi:transcriptional regulator with XRE-family HTH domain
MRERILKFLDKANLSSAKFADDIGVQRSSVSHILSGRNNPSFEFIQKILTQYKYLNAEWLIMGTGSMYKTVSQGNLFDNLPVEKATSTQQVVPELKIEDKLLPENQIPDSEMDLNNNTVINKAQKTVERIVLFYTDKTFSEYIPEK